MPRPVSTKRPLGLLRSKLGISAAKMAKQLGIGTSTIQQIEQGRIAMSADVALKIAHAYFVDLDWVMHGKASDGIRGIPRDRPWTKELVDQLKSLTKMGQELNTVSDHFQSTLNGFVDLFDHGLEDGKCWQISIDARFALHKITEAYYPKEFKEWKSEKRSTPFPEIRENRQSQSTEKEFSRKPRKRDGSRKSAWRLPQ